MAAVAALLFAPGPAPASEPPEAYLRDQGRDPAAYVASKLDAHPVVILGEAHWIAQDAELVASLVPALGARGATLAMEILPASEQDAIDSLVAAREWDAAAATRMMRAMEWPYVQYRDLLHAAWRFNRDATGKKRVRVLALGPPLDFRARGIDYDAFMADRVLARLAERSRVLVYCGMHHAFTRYYQAELDLRGNAMDYVDRMGNRLCRRLGDRVFLVALHKPLWCGSTETPDYCLPLAGAVDCAATAAGGRPVGFDVVGSPFADLAFSDSCYYVHGHPGLRFAGYTDGYVWTGPVESLRLVDLIPLAEYAPDSTSRAAVAARNPFTDERDVPPERLEAIWREEAAASADPMTKRRWSRLSGWRENCGG